MSYITARQRIAVRRMSFGAEDDLGNKVQMWSAPVDVLAFAVAPGPMVGMEEQSRPHAERVQWTVYAPPDADIRKDDRVEWLGHQYRVERTPLNYSHGPFGFGGGMVAELYEIEA